MNHLDDTTLYRLAERAASGACPAPQETAWIEHIKNCSQCYRRFAVWSHLLECLGPAAQPEDRVLAAVRLTLDRTADRCKAVFGQVRDAAGTRLTFLIPRGAVPATARGRAERRVVRVDGAETDEDLIAYDTEARVLTVQLSLRCHPGLRARAEIRTPDGRVLDLPLHRDEDVLYGRLEGYTEPDARICLVEEDPD